jgi:hypothetical protein
MGLPTPPVLDATEDTKAAHLKGKDKDKDEMEDAISRNHCCAPTRHRSAGDYRLDPGHAETCGAAAQRDSVRRLSAEDIIREQD